MTYWAPVCSIKVSRLLLRLSPFHARTRPILFSSVTSCDILNVLNICALTVRLAMDRETGRQRGFGHIDFKGDFAVSLVT